MSSVTLLVGVFVKGIWFGNSEIILWVCSGQLGKYIIDNKNWASHYWRKDLKIRKGAKL